jgi:glucan 1,3-beta-glucosidase
LHAAPGCQNGFDNGGIKDVCEWHTRPEYQDYSLTALERLAERYGGSHALYGIEVLNEPHWDIPTKFLLQYTQAAYRRIRRYCRPDRVAVVFHDGFRAFREFSGGLPASEYERLVLDIHRYQCFAQEDVDTDIYGHISKAAGEWRQEADDIINYAPWGAYVGEWSLGLNPNMLAFWRSQAHNQQQTEMDDFQQNLAYRAYAAAQLLSFEKYLGWFFWSYKTESMPHWSFRDCVQRGWLPDRFV